MSKDEEMSVEQKMEVLMTNMNKTQQMITELTDILKVSSKESKERDEKLFNFLFSRMDAGVSLRSP